MGFGSSSASISDARAGTGAPKYAAGVGTRHPRATDISRIISDAAYQAYERRLLAQVRAGVVPHHVAIIMDGNRRFAVELGLGNPAQGHERGKDKLEEVLQWCLDIGVRILTVYAFSRSNLTRPRRRIRKRFRLLAGNFRRVGETDGCKCTNIMHR